MENNRVMTIAALQKRVLKNITSVEDKAVLEKINELIDQTTKVYVLSEYELAKLKQADEDLKNGDFIDGDEMDRRVEKWLNEK